jgi:fucose 4-O-acetylase-like acetyltransferase
MDKLADRQKINLEGIQILRMLLSLWIVLIHCCNIRNKILNKLLRDKGFHVPIFLIISFYFFYDKLYLRSINKIKLRFERLLIPYMIYPIIIIILNHIFFVKNNIKYPYRQLFFYFIKQLIFGMGIHGIFWFQFFVIFLSVLFLIIAFIFKKNFLVILKLILIICYLLQYSGLVFEYFKKFKEKPNRYFGSIVEIIPYTVTGLIFASYNLINKINKMNKIKEKKKIIFDCIIILYFIEKYDIIRSNRGFRYPGIALNLGSICLIICFSFITFKRTNKFLFIIKYISNYTGGVYYLHEIVKDNLKNKFSFIAKKTMLAGFAIYIICYLICFIGMMIFGRTKLKNLFY